MMLLVVALALMMSLYYVLRYAGHWAENDTSTLTVHIRNVAQAGHLIPEDKSIYFAGYAYQAIVTFLMRLTGASVVVLQQRILPLALVLLVFPAWLLFREISSSGRIATLATVLLVVQPELLFVIMRGSHEKFGRLFMIMALFLLFRSYRTQTSLRHFAIYVGMFYLVTFSLIASNFLIGSSFIFALAFALFAHVVLERTRFWHARFASVSARRLIIVVSACFILAFLIMFYFYPPAQYDVYVMTRLGDKLRALTLGGSEATDVYGRVFAAWVSPWIYAIINSANWLAILFSLPLWLYQGARWFLGKNERRTPVLWLLWLLYGAFGFQMLATIISDASGAFNNLQYRIFPSFSVLAVMLIAANLHRWQRGVTRPVLRGLVIGGAVALLAVLAPIKATNDPNLVGWWVFYTQPELGAIQWTGAKVSDASIWVGFTNRLADTVRLIEGSPGGRNALDTYAVDPGSHYFLASDVIRAQAARLGVVLPEIGSSLTVYDNGRVQIYHRRPVTPYQR